MEEPARGLLRDRDSPFFLGIAFRGVGDPLKAPLKISLRRSWVSLARPGCFMPHSLFHSTKSPHVMRAGRCIYCRDNNTTGLSREHVLPAALGGGLIILDASCEPHRDKINKEIETPVLNHWLGPFRYFHGLSTGKRSNHASRPTKVKIVHQNQSVERRLIPPSQLPPPLILPIPASAPSLLTDNKEQRVGWKDVFLAAHVGKSVELSRQITDGDIAIEAHLPLARFIRFLAKIAHGTAFVNFDGKFEPLLLDIIEGDGFETAGCLIGLDTDEPHKATKPRSHILKTRVIHAEDIRIIAVTIQLFANFPTPPYLVLAGLYAAGLHPAWEMSVNEARTTSA